MEENKIEQNFPSVKQDQEKDNLTKNDKKQQKNLEKMQKSDKNGKNTKFKSVSRAKTAAIIALAITTGALGASTIGLSVAVGVNTSKMEDYANRLEAVYKKSFYDLVDNVNNAEIKLSKVLASNSASYQKKLLAEVSDNTGDAQVNISSLPINQSSLNDSVGLLNQVSGYTQTLNEKLAEGQSLTSGEIETLDKVHSVLEQIKQELNRLAIKVREGYNILNNSMDMSSENNFTLDLSKIKTVDVDYPTMIYDGPFSDSVTNVPVKGLTGEKVSKDEVKENIAKKFKNITSLEFERDTIGRFETYNYRLKTSDNTSLYVQATQKGGHILTVSGSRGNDGEIALDMASAQVIAVDFAKDNGIENPYVVWTDQIGSDGYFNIAPTERGIILYPDLVKVKVDLSSGTILGYDATSYFTNHVSRAVMPVLFSQDNARKFVPEDFVIKSERLVLAPIDYNRQVLCWEFACDSDGNEYYFYINAQTGVEENILRVIQTENGNKLL